MVANLGNNTYLFSADMEDIRITDVHEKLAFKMTVDGQEALSEVYYPDSENAVVICDPGTIINEYFVRPELGSGDDWIALPPMTVQLSISDSEAAAEYTLYVFHSRYRVSFEPLTGFIFYSRYKIKHIRQNTIDYLSFLCLTRLKCIWISSIWSPATASRKPLSCNCPMPTG